MTEKLHKDAAAVALRIEELTRTLVYANALGVRAELCRDAGQRAEAARIYREAKEELAQLRGKPATRDGCNYVAESGAVCKKCWQIHDGAKEKSDD